MIRRAYWLTTLLILGLVAAKFSPATGLTSLIRFGETWQAHRHSALASLPVATVAQSTGYDGQFYAQLALDPTLRDREFPGIIDVPAYRARRILVPAAAHVLGFGQPWWILNVYASLNVLCWLALAGLLYRELDSPDTLTGFARWFGCVAGLGVLDSVRQSLVDLPALLLLVLALRACRQSSQIKTSAWLILANLAKETSLLGALALHADALLIRDRRRRAVLILALTTLPLALWGFYVQLRFTAIPPSTGLGNFAWPFVDLFITAQEFFFEVARGNFDSRFTFGLLGMVGLVTQAVVLWRRPQFANPWWRVGAIYALLLPFLGVWVWSGYWAAFRAALPLTIAFNLLLPANRAFWPVWILGNCTVAHALWRFL